MRKTVKLKPSDSPALVTGADSGIGLCFCRELARRGHPLIMVSNRTSELTAAAELLSSEFNVPTFTFTCDLTADNAAQSLYDSLIHNNLKPEILINNAGIFSFSPVLETSIDKAGRFIDLHVRAVTELCRLIGSDMAVRGHGRILNMSSMSCWMPMPGIALYSATKAYIRVFSRALHYELADSGVSVTVAAPGGIATDLFGLPAPLKRLAIRIKVLDTPESFARKCLRRMFKGKPQYINGLLNKISIIAVGVSPRFVRMAIKRKMLDRGIRK